MKKFLQKQITFRSSKNEIINYQLINKRENLPVVKEVEQVSTIFDVKMEVEEKYLRNNERIRSSKMRKKKAQKVSIISDDEDFVEGSFRSYGPYASSQKFKKDAVPLLKEVHQVPRMSDDEEDFVEGSFISYERYGGFQKKQVIKKKSVKK